MNRSRSNQVFLFVGNHSCLDFINTQMILRGNLTDLLETFDDFVAWLVQAKQITKDEGECASRRLTQKEKHEVLGQVKAFRTIVRDMAEHLVRRHAIPGAVVLEINRLLSRRQGYPQVIQTKGRFEQKVVTTGNSTDSLLTHLAVAASDLLCNADQALIKKCRNEACILYFYDTTKSHTRNWCSMQLCGNRLKVAAHFQRKRQSKRKKE